MARTCRKPAASPAASVLAAMVAMLAAAAAAAVPDFSGLPVTVDADSSEVDYKSNTVVFKNPVISQGDMRVRAEHGRATGLNFANSRWNFEGNVRMDAEQRGNLRSDQAVVEFRDNHIARVTITGKPAEFEQKRANTDQIARGHADEIVYDVNDGTVRLRDDAWLSDGQNEISGPLLVYNIREQRVQAAAVPDASAGTDQRVHISIAPHPVKPDAPRSDAVPKGDAAKPTPKEPAASPESAPKS